MTISVENLHGSCLSHLRTVLTSSASSVAHSTVWGHKGITPIYPPRWVGIQLMLRAEDRKVRRQMRPIYSCTGYRINMVIHPAIVRPL